VPGRTCPAGAGFSSLVEPCATATSSRPGESTFGELMPSVFVWAGTELRSVGSPGDAATTAAVTPPAARTPAASAAALRERMRM